MEVAHCSYGEGDARNRKASDPADTAPNGSPGPTCSQGALYVELQARGKQAQADLMYQTYMSCLEVGAVNLIKVEILECLWIECLMLA
jgi:hypothetical protein